MKITSYKVTLQYEITEHGESSTQTVEVSPRSAKCEADNLGHVVGRALQRVLDAHCDIDGRAETLEKCIALEDELKVLRAPKVPKPNAIPYDAPVAQTRAHPPQPAPKPKATKKTKNG